MRLAEYLLLVPTLFYAFAAITYAWESKPGLAIAFGSYAMANAGLIWAAVR